MSKKTVWVLGANGMLGSMVFDYLSQQPGLEVFGTVRDASQDQRRNIVELDVNQPRALRELWQTQMFEAHYIINCIGLIKPRISDDTDGYLNAIRLNAEFPHRLADLVEYSDTRVIHASTDCVFSGDDRRFYDESSPSDVTDVYGLTKYLGESPRNMNIRVSIIGPEINGRKQSLYEWYMNNDPTETVNGFTNHSWNGVTTLTWASIIHTIIDRDLWRAGIKHFASPDVVTKCDLLKFFKENARRRGITTSPIQETEAVGAKFMCLSSVNLPYDQHFAIDPIGTQVFRMVDYVENTSVANA